MQLVMARAVKVGWVSLLGGPDLYVVDEGNTVLHIAVTTGEEYIVQALCDTPAQATQELWGVQHVFDTCSKCLQLATPARQAIAAQAELP